MTQQATLFEAIGGAAAVNAAVDEFYHRVLADTELAPYFAGVDVVRLKGHQRAFLTVALSGPGWYTGRSMHAAHARLGITDAHFNRVAVHLTETLQSLGVPAARVEQVIGTVAALRPEIVTAEVEGAA